MVLPYASDVKSGHKARSNFIKSCCNNRRPDRNIKGACSTGSTRGKSTKLNTANKNCKISKHGDAEDDKDEPLKTKAELIKNKYISQSVKQLCTPHSDPQTRFLGSFVNISSFYTHIYPSNINSIKVDEDAAMDVVSTGMAKQSNCIQDIRISRFDGKTCIGEMLKEECVQKAKLDQKEDIVKDSAEVVNHDDVDSLLRCCEYLLNTVCKTADDKNERNKGRQAKQGCLHVLTTLAPEKISSFDGDDVNYSDSEESEPSDAHDKVSNYLEGISDTNCTDRDLSDRVATGDSCLDIFEHDTSIGNIEMPTSKETEGDMLCGGELSPLSTDVSKISNDDVFIENVSDEEVTNCRSSSNSPSSDEGSFHPHQYVSPPQGKRENLKVDFEDPLLKGFQMGLDVVCQQNSMSDDNSHEYSISQAGRTDDPIVKRAIERLDQKMQAMGCVRSNGIPRSDPPHNNTVHSVEASQLRRMSTPLAKRLSQNLSHSLSLNVDNGGAECMQSLDHKPLSHNEKAAVVLNLQGNHSQIGHSADPKSRPTERRGLYTATLFRPITSAHVMARGNNSSSREYERVYDEDEPLDLSCVKHDENPQRATSDKYPGYSNTYQMSGFTSNNQTSSSPSMSYPRPLSVNSIFYTNTLDPNHHKSSPFVAHSNAPLIFLSHPQENANMEHRRLERYPSIPQISVPHSGWNNNGWIDEHDNKQGDYSDALLTNYQQSPRGHNGSYNPFFRECNVPVMSGRRPLRTNHACDNSSYLNQNMLYRHNNFDVSRCHLSRSPISSTPLSHSSSSFLNARSDYSRDVTENMYNHTDPIARRALERFDICTSESSDPAIMQGGYFRDYDLTGGAEIPKCTNCYEQNRRSMCLSCDYVPSSLSVQSDRSCFEPSSKYDNTRDQRFNLANDGVEEEEEEDGYLDTNGRAKNDTFAWSGCVPPHKYSLQSALQCDENIIKPHSNGDDLESECQVMDHNNDYARYTSNDVADFERRSEYNLRHIFNHLERQDFRVHSSKSAFRRTPTYQYKSYSKEYTKPLNANFSYSQNDKEDSAIANHFAYRTTQDHSPLLNSNVQMRKRIGLLPSTSYSNLLKSNSLSKSNGYDGYMDPNADNDALDSQTITLSGRSTPSCNDGKDFASASHRRRDGMYARSASGNGLDRNKFHERYRTESQPAHAYNLPRVDSEKRDRNQQLPPRSPLASQRNSKDLKMDTANRLTPQLDRSNANFQGKRYNCQVNIGSTNYTDKRPSIAASNERKNNGSHVEKLVKANGNPRPGTANRPIGAKNVYDRLYYMKRR